MNTTLNLRLVAVSMLLGATLLGLGGCERRASDTPPASTATTPATPMPPASAASR